VEVMTIKDMVMGVVSILVVEIITMKDMVMGVVSIVEDMTMKDMWS